MKVSMKLWLQLIFIILTIHLKSQEISKVEISFVKWDTKYVTITTIENISERSEFFFLIKNADYFTFEEFYDYEGFIAFIGSQCAVIKEYKENIFINSYVKLYFGAKIIELYFERYGDFYFEGKWFKRNDNLYVNLFNYFSNELVPEFVLVEARKNMIKLNNQK